MKRWFAAVLLVLAANGCGEERQRSSDDDDDGASAGPTTAGVGGAGSGSGSGGSSSTSGVGGAEALLPGDLVITEIMNNPAIVLDEAGEWFEIHNTTDRVIDLAGLLIRHQADPAVLPHTIAESVMVPPGGYAVLGCNGDTLLNGGIAIDYVYGAEASLHNTSDHLAIEAGDVVIDETNWDETSGLDPSGSSRSLDPQFVAWDMNDDDAHFCAASSPIAGSTDYGTPGAANDLCP